MNPVDILWAALKARGNKRILWRAIYYVTMRDLMERHNFKLATQYLEWYVWLDPK